MIWFYFKNAEKDSKVLKQIELIIFEECRFELVQMFHMIDECEKSETSDSKFEKYNTVRKTLKMVYKTLKGRNLFTV